MSTRFLTVEDIHRYLDSIPAFGKVGPAAANFSLVQIETFCQRMGDPQKRLKAIHVAGTNGKGTTCQMLASVYRQAGYRTGLYTSPHLVSFHERIRVDGEMISDRALLAFFQQFERDLNELPLTYFELCTSIAFWYFDRENVDIAVIETGLGGRLDATNLLEPMASVITSVSVDHTDLLGESIAEIAREKAGIIKPARPVVTGRLPDEAFQEIKRVAMAAGSPLSDALSLKPECTKSEFILTDGDKTITINRNKRKKIDAVNSAISRTVVSLLNADFPLSDKEFITGIEQTDSIFPEHAHFQRLHESFRWYFDGAHNSEAINTLLDEIESIPGGENAVLFLSMMKDKALPGLLRKLDVFSTICYMDLGLERSASCDQILQQLPYAECYNLSNKRAEARLEQLKSELVIFTGSFYFYSQVKKWMAILTPSSDSISLRA